MKFAWIQEHKKEFEVSVMCHTLNVSRSGYYARRSTSLSPRQERRQQLLEQIREVHQQSRGLYGSPRIHAELVDQQVQVCVNTVARLSETGADSIEDQTAFCGADHRFAS